jgi:hypothetical protein
MYHIVEGRRPEGLVMPASTPNTVLGDYFARAAYLDAASASAFLRLASELETHGAPGRMVDECHRAHLTELRHAAALGTLAEHYRVAVMAPEAREFSVRPLVAVALENIVEGFVRETFGTVVARCRARSAGNARIRQVMKKIAPEERGHAQLAFEIATWLQNVLTRVECVWVENAMRHAVRSLAHEIDVDTDIDLSWQVGVPSRDDALAIWSGLSQRVWHRSSDRDSARERVWNAAA